VVAFGIAADQLAHYLAEDHIRTSLIAFGFVTFAITWAWINFSWFASAYDTDDWIFRLLTLVARDGRSRRQWSAFPVWRSHGIPLALPDRRESPAHGFRSQEATTCTRA
jgi:hypothetical protein